MLFLIVAAACAAWVGREVWLDPIGRGAVSGLWRNISPDPLAGRVTDVATGQGISGAEITIQSRGWNAFDPINLWTPSVLKKSIRTRSDGRFATHYRRLSKTQILVSMSEYPHGRATLRDTMTLDIRMTHVGAGEGQPRDRYFGFPIPGDSTAPARRVIVAFDLETLDVAADSTQGDVTIELIADPEPSVVVVAREGGGVLYRSIRPDREWRVQAAECLAPLEGYAPRTVVSASDEVGICFVRWDGGRKFARLELRPRWMTSVLGAPNPVVLNLRGWTNPSGGRNLCPSGPALVTEF